MTDVTQILATVAQGDPGAAVDLLPITISDDWRQGFPEGGAGETKDP